MKYYFDGSANNMEPENRNARYCIRSEDDSFMKVVSCGNMTSNGAEYEGLINLLRYLIRENIKDAEIYSDSQLVVNQVTCKWKIKKISPVYNACIEARILYSASKASLKWIPRELNLAGYVFW